MAGIRTALTGFLVLVMGMMIWCGSAEAVGIRVVPSTQRVLPGEDFFVDVVAEGIPAAGLGGAQFRLNVAAPGGTVKGVSDLGQGGGGEVAVASPLLISPPTATRSGIGAFFWNGRSADNGVLVLDNEPLVNGSGLYTFAHTNGSTPPSGSGPVARFMIRVDRAVEAKSLEINLSDVMLLDGGPFYPLDSNIGATVQVGCFTRMPELSGLSLAEATARLIQAQLAVGATREIDNPGGTKPLNVILEQSLPAGSEQLCETAVDLTVNFAPAEVTGAAASDKAGDDSGAVTLSWTPSPSSDTAGYRIYQGSRVMSAIANPGAGGAELGGLPIGVASPLSIAAYDSYGNESTGVAVTATALDDVSPLVEIGGVSEGAYYRGDVLPSVSISDSNLASQSVTLNGAAFLPAPITADGAYTLTATGADRFGNETSRSVRFSVDQSAPVITVTGPSNGGFYNTDLAPAIAISDVNLKESWATLNGQPYSSGSPVSAEGSYLLLVSAEDLAGNSASQTIGFTIDKSAPVSAAEIGVPRFSRDGVVYVGGATPVSIAAQDTGIASSGVAGIEYAIDGSQSRLPYAGPVTLAGLADGSHTLSYKASDRAGNGEALQTIELTADNSAPATALTLAGPSQTIADGAVAVTSTTSFELKAADLLSGVARTEYRIDGGAWTAYAPFTLKAQGTHMVEYRSADNLDNLENVNSRSAVVDNTAPVSELTVGSPRHTAQDGTLYVQGSTTLTLAATDNISGVQRTEYQVDGGEWVPFQSAFTVAAAGSHTVNYRSVDRVGNLEQARSLAFVVDVAPPVTTITTGAPQHAVDGNLFVRSTTTFTLAAMDELSGVAATRYRIDDGAWTPYAPFTVASEGAHVIRYRSLDNVENQEAEKSLAVIVDDTAPVSAIAVGNPKYQGGDALFATSATLFTVSATDAGSGVERIEYRLDGGAWLPYAPFSLSAEGVHTIGYRAVDKLGNLEEVKSLTVTVDNTAPSSDLSVGTPRFTAADATLYVSSATTFTVAASDNLSGVARTDYRTGSGAWTPYAPFTVAGEGSHLIGYRSIDNVTNSESDHLAPVTVDNTPPVTLLAVGAPRHDAGGKLYVTAASLFTLSATDNLSGVARTEYRIDGGAWTTYAPFTITSEGEHLIVFRSADNVANSEVEKSVRLTIDNTPPATVIGSAGPRYLGSDGTTFVTSATSFTLTSTDDLSGVAKSEYRIDGGAWTLYAPFALTVEGNHLIGFRSSDNVSNIETEKTLPVTVDNSAPKTVIAVASPQYTTKGKLYATGITNFTLSATDTLSGVARTEYRIDGGAWAPYTPFTIAAEGDHVIAFRSADNVGNLETEQVLYVTIDNTPPVTTIAVAAPRHEAEGKLYATSSTLFSLSAADNLSGVASVEYRVDGAGWLPYAPFSLPAQGSHTIGYRSVDNLGALETERVLAVIIDDTPPLSTAAVGTPQYYAAGKLYVSGRTEIAILSSDNASGVLGSEYGIDTSDLHSFTAAFTLSAFMDGNHSVAYRSLDNLKNLEAVKKLELVLDKSAPKTVLTASDPLLPGVVNTVSLKTRFSLAATDNLSGVNATWYRVDGGGWQLYSEPFTLAGLSAGTHNISYTSSDRVENDEAEVTVAVRLIQAEVKKEISLDPVVLVGAWSDNQNKIKNDASLAALKPILSSLGINFRIAQTGDEFKSLLRSGRFTTYLLMDYRDEKVGAELREAVNYGDSVIFIKTLPATDPALDEIFGVKFTGKTTGASLAVNLAETPLGPAATLQTSGKSVIGSVIAKDVETFGYVDDGRNRYPSVVLNAYGSGRALLFTFDLLKAADSDKTADLVTRSLVLLKPGKHNARALGSVPVAIAITGSKEPLGLRVTETLPAGTSADSVTPQGTATDATIVWEQHLGAGSAGGFGYYLNLPDLKGEYTATTELQYANQGQYAPFETAQLSLAVQSDSSDLLRGAITALRELNVTGSAELVALTNALTTLSAIAVDPQNLKDAEKGIESVAAVTKQIRALSADTAAIRAGLDELLKILERKWYLLYIGSSTAR